VEAEFERILAQVDELERLWLALTEDARQRLRREQPALAEFFGRVKQ
jgi:hypothetical protein